MSGSRKDGLISVLNSLGFYTEDGRHYSNGSLTVERAGSSLVGITLEALEEKLTFSSPSA